MKRLSFITLLLGILLSQIFVLKFNLNDGFQFHGFWIKFLPIAQYAGKTSSELFLTSTFLGYIFFIVFGVLNTNKIKYPQIFKPALLFSAIAIVVCFFEFTSIFEDLNSSYEGKYFRIGWLLFLLGVWIFSKNYLSKK